MEILLIITIASCLIFLVVYQRKKQLRIQRQFLDSELITSLERKGFEWLEADLLVGNIRGYVVDLAYDSDIKQGLSLTLSTRCKLPGLKGMKGFNFDRDFKKRFQSDRFFIEPPDRISVSYTKDALVKLNGDLAFEILEKQVRLCENECFDPI